MPNHEYLRRIIGFLFSFAGPGQSLAIPDNLPVRTDETRLTQRNALNRAEGKPPSISRNNGALKNFSINE